MCWKAELFGLENGQVKPGKLDLCQKGTLLLDDVTEMPLNVQAKLLGVLRDGYFVRSGSESRIEMDVRILAATQANLEQAIAERKDPRRPVLPSERIQHAPACVTNSAKRRYLFC